ncbi:hypothetical protein [Flammeovirga aprica]|uniref:Uncharacterized protein n=1 Tax=Flammeovirga aprica JL-4 TaxID=694437 RepID=A0A7X9S0T0_9BACT|nr:hypothetical protein [Flammeovirga aprica]NME72301.1 hypothetical protein [Flammeovirga aprica JL-4]
MYSPDSTYYIDMDSYGLEILEYKDGSLEYMGREVDIKVYLVKAAEEDSSAIELMMCGTSCFPEEAYWEDKSTVSILGMSYNDRTEKVYPTLWKYNIKTNSFVKFLAQQDVNNTGDENYFEKYRLQKILSSK